MSIVVFKPRTGAPVMIVLREPRRAQDKEGGQRSNEYLAPSPSPCGEDVFELPCAEEGSTAPPGFSDYDG
jgi:hypothetical protein